MKTRSTILALAALVTLSVSALATTPASAWEDGYRGGYRDGYQYSGRHFGGYGSMGNFRPSYRPYVTDAAPSYAPAPVANYAPAPTVNYQRPYIRRPAYVAAPTAVPCDGEATGPRVDAPAPQPQRQAYVAPQPQAYVAPQPQPQAYVPPQQPEETYEEEAPGMQSETPEQQPAQDRRPATYSSRELQR
jgi:hypothetical protein